MIEITIERNGDEQQQESRGQDEREHEPQVRLHRVVEVLRSGGKPAHVRRGAWDPSDRGRHQMVTRSWASAALDFESLPFPGQGDVDLRDRPVGIDVSRHRLLEQRVCGGLLAKIGDGATDLG